HDQLESLAERLAVGCAEALPAAVRARAILDDAAAQRLAARPLHHAGGFHDLPLAFDRTGAGDEHEVVAAARDVTDVDGVEDPVPRRPLLRHALVGARDGDELFDPGQLRDLALRQLRDVAVDADQRDLLAFELAGLEAEIVQLPLDGGDLVRRGVAAHLDEHGAHAIEPCPGRQVAPRAATGAVNRFTPARDLAYEAGQWLAAGATRMASPSTSARRECARSCSTKPVRWRGRHTGRPCPSAPRPAWCSTTSSRCCARSRASCGP